MTVPKPKVHWCGTCGMLLGLMDQMVVKFKKLSPEEQERFRRESMKETYAYLSRVQWEKDNPTRPYDSESKN